MKKHSILAILLILLGGFYGPVQAQESSDTETGATLKGQCRQTNRRVDVYSKPSVGVDSDVVTRLAEDTEVVLDSNGVNGWVAISKPELGFIIARYLKPCTPKSDKPATSGNNSQPANPSKPSGPLPTRPVPSVASTIDNITKNSCRQAIVDLAVFSRPERIPSLVVGGVKENQRVTLTGQRQNGANERIWVEISSPRKGWVSGGRAGGSNLILCP